MRKVYAYCVKRFILTAGVFAFIASATGTVVAAREAALPVYRDMDVPDSLSLCGEALPLGVPAVREMLDRELTISVWDQAQVFM